MEHHPELTFFVNDEAIVVHTAALTVREILDNAGLSATDYTLIEHRAGNEIRLTALDESIALHDGIRFAAEQREYHIVVNGRERTVERAILTFEEVVALAPNLPPPGPDVEYRVSFRDAEEPRSGDLIAGENVRIKDGTQFVVTPTNRS
jgi:hypothetical protein